MVGTDGEVVGTDGEVVESGKDDERKWEVKVTRGEGGEEE